jgi:hypothetical protein
MACNGAVLYTRAMRMFCLSMIILSALPMPGQKPAAAPQTEAETVVWQMQDSGSTASLRGIDSVDGQVAWASGSEGTVLRTLDGGAHWTRCATPDGDKDGAALDFRGVQAWDRDTAIVMASGPGEKSRLYKTADGCKSWTLLLKNTDPEGFYDAFHFWTSKHGFLLGDPIRRTPFYKEHDGSGLRTGENYGYTERSLKQRRFLTLTTPDGGIHWAYWGTGRGDFTESAASDGAAFAASNTSVFVPAQIESPCDKASKNSTSRIWAGIGGKGGARVLIGIHVPVDVCPNSSEHDDEYFQAIRYAWSEPRPVPVSGHLDSAGVFSVGFRMDHGSELKEKNITGFSDVHGYNHGIAVGGDYLKPNESAGTAAWSADSGWTWTASAIPPHGYRSAVQWSEPLQLWITAGSNGSDLSRDDGKSWQPLDYGNWNALSLPFVVGPQGRIGRLNPALLVGAGKTTPRP